MPNATQVLERFWDGKLPVDVERIADSMGVRVRPDPYMQESGAISYVGPRPQIDFNPRDARVRRRFTIAHELGHYALGHLENGSKKFRDPASNFSSRAIPWEEREANQFAAELLMPAGTLKYAVNQRRIADLARLAVAFGVSQVAMGYRLSNLGLLRA